MAALSAEIQNFVKLQKLGFIATVCPDGTPNLSPKGTVSVWRDHQLVFLDINSPGTVNNLKLNPAVEINVVDIFARKGYRFKGTAEVILEGDVFDAIVASYGEAARKYTVKHVVLVNVERILEVTSPAYDTGATEPEIRTRWMHYWDEVNERSSKK